jgi:drug/metabolite transporter (DMT)-like permease
MISTAMDMVSGKTNGHGLRRVIYGSGWAALSLAILSGWFVVTRLGFRHELGVWDIIALRFGEGAVLLTPSLVVGKFRLPLRAWIRGIPLAILWGAPFIFLVGTGLRLTSATLASSIAPALMPVFAGAMSWLAFGGRPRPLQFSGYVLIATGLVALVVTYASLTGRPDSLGLLCLAVAAAMWAAHTLRLRGSGLSPLQATALICFWSAVVYVPVYATLGLSNLASASAAELLFQSVYQGLLMSVVAVFAFNRAVASLGPRAAAAVIALVPVTVTVLAIPFLDEFPSASSSVIITVIAAGVMLAAGSGKSISTKGENGRQMESF